jgi:hypothetical protein
MSNSITAWVLGSAMVGTGETSVSGISSTIECCRGSGEVVQGMFMANAAAEETHRGILVMKATAALGIFSGFALRFVRPHLHTYCT